MKEALKATGQIVLLFVLVAVFGGLFLWLAQSALDFARRVL